MVFIMNFEIVFGRILLLSIGVICIMAGIKGWNFPSIRVCRGTWFGEIFNTIIMVYAGSLCLWAVIQAWIENR